MTTTYSAIECAETHLTLYSYCHQVAQTLAHPKLKIRAKADSSKKIVTRNDGILCIFGVESTHYRSDFSLGSHWLATAPFQIMIYIIGSSLKEIKK